MAKSRNSKMQDTKCSDLEFMKDPNQWPNMFCPVKRHTSSYRMPETGIYFHGTPTVVILNMWAGWTTEEFKAAKKHEYKSLEDLVADGWVVD